MTREEAISMLEQIGRHECIWMVCRHNEVYKAINTAIEALREMSVEQYRQRLMEVFHNTDHDELLTYVVMPKEEEFKSLEYILRQYKYEPRPHGEWARYTEEGFDYAKCSACKWDSGEAFEYAIDRFHFCPNCGSDNRPKKHGCSFADEECKNNPCEDCGLKEG